MSLADELLADLEDDEVFDDDDQSNLESMEIVPNESNLESTQKQYASVRSLTKIIGSDELGRIIAEINGRQSNDGNTQLIEQMIMIFLLFLQ